MERTDVSMLSNCAPSTSATVPQSVTTTVLALQDGNSPVRCSEPGKLQIHMSFGQGAALCLSGNSGVGGAHLWSTMVTSRRASSVPSRERFTLPSAPTWGPTFVGCAQPERMKGLQYYSTAPWVQQQHMQVSGKPHTRDDAQHVDQHLLAGILRQVFDSHVLEPHTHLVTVPIRACLNIRPA